MLLFPSADIKYYCKKKLLNVVRFKSFMKNNGFFWLILVFSLISFGSVFIPPTSFWPAVFSSYAIPGILVLNAILLLILIPNNKRLMVFPVIALLAGIPFISITYSYKGEKAANNHDLSVLSFNAKLFRKAKMYSEFSGEMIAWVANDSSDIKCIQEYSTNARWEPLDVTKKNLDAGYNGFAHQAQIENPVHNPGLAIFSKYPILDSGIVWVQPETMNDGIFADVLVGFDTIRIYNVHLASMNLELYQYKNSANYPGKIKRLISRLKNGAEVRSSQIGKLISHTQECPFPFIICGDFNETPYSYNYFRLKRYFQNAFDEAGNGFGFTLNSILFFLRIDHQFYSDQLKAKNYYVNRQMKVSDHFPTYGFYQLK